MSNCDNFPSIHSFLWKVKNTDEEREITWTIYNLWNGHNRKKKMTVRKCRTINRYVNVGLINTPSKASQAEKNSSASLLCAGGGKEKKKERNDHWEKKYMKEEN